MKYPTRALTWTTIGVILSFPLSASAADGVIERPTDEGQDMVFDDDPLAATGGVAAGLLLHVHANGKRTTLIRPRTRFLRELVQSAEDL